jgi:hypothetical protein
MSKPLRFQKHQLEAMRALIETSPVEAFVLDRAGIVVTRHDVRKWQHTLYGAGANEIAIPVLAFEDEE